MKPGAAGSGSQEEESSGRTSLNWPERCGAMGEKWSQGARGAWRCWEQSGRGRFILTPQSTLRDAGGPVGQEYLGTLGKGSFGGGS